nr:hypothetical protein [Heyndrickxia oleronia]
MHIYWLGGGLFPLDWEFCFLTVSEYKEKLIEKERATLIILIYKPVDWTNCLLL